MKWPESVIIVRHAQSDYNRLRAIKESDELYRLFKKAYQDRFFSLETRALAKKVRNKFALGISDHKTPLSKEGMHQARGTGYAMSRVVDLPDVIFVSPYLRTKQTLQFMIQFWPELKNVKTISEDRIREQEHGLALLYNDWRVFHVFHPEQKELYELMGMYYYQYPQGESVSQVRERIRSFTSTLIREWAGKKVMLITHHLTILSIRANFERLSPEEFIRLDREEKPKNCGVTEFKGNPVVGTNGKLELKYYNRYL